MQKCDLVEETAQRCRQITTDQGGGETRRLPAGAELREGHGWAPQEEVFAAGLTAPAEGAYLACAGDELRVRLPVAIADQRKVVRETCL